jgi:hypothetical protein
VEQTGTTGHASYDAIIVVVSEIAAPFNLIASVIAS